MSNRIAHLHGLFDYALILSGAFRYRKFRREGLGNCDRLAYRIACLKRTGGMSNESGPPGPTI